MQVAALKQAGCRTVFRDEVTGAEDAVGRCFVHDNFASVSRSHGVSANFGDTSMLKFVVPAGANGVVLGSQYGEKEIVLPALSVFRVMKVEPKCGGKNRIHVMYLGSEDAIP